MRIKLLLIFAKVCVFFCFIDNFAAAAPQSLKYSTNFLCIAPFTLIGKKCYFLGVSDKLNCNNAAEKCAKLDAELTKIENEQEMKAINDFLISLYDIKSKDDKEFWIAGNDWQYRGFFFWRFPFERMNYTKWAAGRPNRGHALNENCVQLVDERDAYVMHDTASTEHSHYICEKSKPPLDMHKAKETNQTPCPAGFTRIGVKCVFIERHEELDLLTARIRCGHLNAQLADIKNAPELEALSAHLTSLNERHDYRVLSKSFRDLLDEKYAQGNAAYDNCVQLFYMDGAYATEKCSCKEKMRFICESVASSPESGPNSANALEKASGAAVGKQCPALFTALRGRCYFVEDYMSLDQRSAADSCQQLGAELSKIESGDQLTALTKHFKGYGALRKLWIAGTKRHNAGEFFWHNATAPVSYTKWAADEPTAEVAAEKCLKLVYDDTGEYFMRSADCREAIFFACETETLTPHLASAPERPTEATDVTAHECPQYFELVGGRCYYFANSTKNNWHKARSVCYGMGVDLVKIGQKQDENTLFEYLKKMENMQTFWIASTWKQPEQAADHADFDFSCLRLVRLNDEYQIDRNSCLYSDRFICEGAPLALAKTSYRKEANAQSAFIPQRPHAAIAQKNATTFRLLKESHLQPGLRLSGGSAAGRDMKVLYLNCFTLSALYAFLSI